VNPGGPILVLDTATTRAVVALGTPAGRVLAARDWLAGYRHGEELLPHVERLIGDQAVAPADLGGLVVGTGPGAFTGLRVGIATAKGLAHALALPIVGIATGSAIIAAAAAALEIEPRAVVLLQPAGPADRVVTRLGEPSRILPGGTEPAVGPRDVLVAVDLDGRAPAEAVSRGDVARDGLADALLVAGAERLAAGDADDLARLVPEYVTLPRGLRSTPPDDRVELTGGRAARGPGA
jgi:tRNA threonylcarbamoyladenosine biosynthesis protein TsaB